MFFRHPLVRRACGLCWAIFSVLVIGAAVLLSIARMLLPLMDDYRASLEVLMSAQLDRPVRIGGVNAGWWGVHPQLRLTDVSVFEKDGKRLWFHLEEVQASVNVIDSILKGTVDTGKVTFVGANLDIERYYDGRYFVSGVQAGLGGRELLAWLAGRQRVTLVNSDVTWKDPRFSAEPVQLRQVDLQLRKRGDLYHLHGSAVLPSQQDRRLSFVVNLEGDPTRPETLSTQFYLQGSLQLGPWLNGSVLENAVFRRGDLDLKIWGKGRDSVIAEVGLRNVRWDNQIADSRKRDAPQPSSFSLDHFSGTTFWRRLTSGWSLRAQRVTISRDGRTWRPASIHLVSTTDAEKRQVLDGSFGFVRLQDLSAFLLSAPGLGDAFRANLTSLNARGDLHNLAFRLRRASHQIEHFYVTTRFDDLGFNHWEKLPGVEGLDGSLVLNDNAGYVELQSRSASFDLPRLFRAPLPADVLAGKFYWHASDGAWRVVSPNFRAENQDIKGEGQFSVDIPRNGDSPFLDLELGFRDGNVAHVSDYLPRRILSPKVVKWLDESLANGRVTSGSMVYFGRTSDFPFDNDRGSFRASFGVEDLLLDYAQNWPRAEEVDAEVTFVDRSLQVKIEHGKVYGLDVRPSAVVIDELSGNAVLNFNGDLQGPISDMLRYLRESPLGHDDKAYLDGLRVSGPGNLNLDLRLPLLRMKEHSVRGTVHFSGGDLFLTKWDVGLASVKGDLGFSSSARKGLLYTAKGIQARFRDAPARVDVSSRDDPSGRSTNLDIRTRVDAATLTGPEGAFLKKILKGKSDWLVRASIHEGNGQERPRVGLHLQSALRGTEVSLPGDFAKAANADRTLIIDTAISEEDLGPIEISYGDKAKTVLVLRNGSSGWRIERGELRFGGEDPVLPHQPGLMIAGKLPKFSLADWKTWAAPHAELVGRTDLLDLVSGLDVQIGEMVLFDYPFRNVIVKASKRDLQWHANVESAELAGDVTFPSAVSDASPIMMNLVRLELMPPQSGGDRTEAPDPRKLPPLYVTSEKFTYNKIPFGTLKLVARRTPDGLRLDRVDTKSPLFSVAATGSWEVHNGRDVSRFKIETNTDDLGQTLTRMGYAGGLEGGKARGNIDAHWDGSPGAFELKHLNGTVRLLIRDAQLLNVNPGGGRVFGLLSLQALPRRLSLDFTDLFGKGFSCDRIEGTFAISNGDAYTNDLYMVGPPAQIDISGRIGLADRDYDETVLVTPKVSSTMPLVGGLAGGPGVGLGLWVAEKVFGKKIDELSRIRYSITGSWEDPVVERLDSEQSSHGQSKDPNAS